MKKFKGMSLRAIRSRLERLGVEMSDIQFYALSYAELETIGRKAEKAYRLYEQIDKILTQPSVALNTALQAEEDENEK